MKPLLLALQFHKGDKEQAMALARLLADLGPSPHHLLFYARYDCDHDAATIDYCAQAFAGTHHASSKRKISGWPIGPNAMVMDLFQLSHLKHKRGEWDYSGIMLLESDCVPLRRTWLDEIHQEWAEGKQLVLGHWIGQKNNPNQSHMNGNLIFSPRLTFTFGQLLSDNVPKQAWDVEFWRYYWKAARASKLIYSDYRVKFTDCATLHAPRSYPKGHAFPGAPIQPAWLHGCKDPRALECVRAALLAAKV